MLLLKRLPSLKSVLRFLMQEGSLREVHCHSALQLIHVAYMSANAECICILVQAEVVVGILHHMGSMLLPQHAAAVAQWLQGVAEQSLGKHQHLGLAKALFQGILELSGVLLTQAWLARRSTCLLTSLGA